MAIESIIKSIQNTMREDAGVDGDAQRISQLVWMIFLKIFDDKEREYELLDPNYKSPLPEKLRWRNWAADDEGMTGDELLDFVNNQLFKELKELSFNPKDDPRGFIVKEVFEDAYNYMKSGTLIRKVVNRINEINFKNQKERHLFNDLYEHILKDLQSAGNAGEYYTPRPLTKFVVEMVNPKLNDIILDPACGTGGFLVNAIEHVRDQEVNTADEEKTLQQSIRGVEKKPLPHLLAITNMILHGIETPKDIRRDNMLTRPLRDYGPTDKVDVVVTNPPFGGTEEEGVQANFPKAFRTKETADLFLLLIIQLLKGGGRAGMVLPDGSLFGEGVKTKIKEKLLEECNVHTIIRLPQGVFNPYAGVNTNLVFFEKGEPTKEVWYYKLPLPEGMKQYTKNRGITHQEFDPVRRWWNNRKENEHAWKISIDEIKKRNYNLDFKNPRGNAKIEHKEPKEVLDSITTAEQEIVKLLGEIEKRL